MKTITAMNIDAPVEKRRRGRPRKVKTEAEIEEEMRKQRAKSAKYAKNLLPVSVYDMDINLSSDEDPLLLLTMRVEQDGCVHYRQAVHHLTPQVNTYTINEAGDRIHHRVSGAFDLGHIVVEELDRIMETLQEFCASEGLRFDAFDMLTETYHLMRIEEMMYTVKELDLLIDWHTAMLRVPTLESEMNAQLRNYYIASEEWRETAGLARRKRRAAERTECPLYRWGVKEAFEAFDESEAQIDVQRRHQNCVEMKMIERLSSTARMREAIRNLVNEVERQSAERHQPQG